MAEPLHVYVFRDPHFAPSGDTVVCVAEFKKTRGSLSKKEIGWAFSGYAVYFSCWPWRTYIGVYGSKNASRFRRFLSERDADLVILREPPPQTRLLYWKTEAERRKVRTLPPRAV